MLSVGGSGGRSRSKSPGRRDERDRSRSRDVRAPSPSRRAPPPAAAGPPPRSRKYYDDDEDEDLVSDRDDRRREDYSRAVEKVKPRDYDGRRGKYSDDDSEEEEEDPRYASQYADPRDPRRQGYAKAEEASSRSRREEPPRTQGYAIPGQFDEEDDGGYRKTKPPYPQPSNGHGRAMSASNTSHGGYSNLPQYQYAEVDTQNLKYVQKGGPQYTRTPSDTSSTYVRNPGAQVTVESKRHRRDESYDGRSAPTYPDAYQSGRYKTERERQKELERQQDLQRQKELERIHELEKAEERRKELTRLAKEKAEFEAVEAKRRELDHLRQEREEREAELRQKQRKNVTIRDDREYKKDSRRDDPRGKKYYDDESESDDDDERLQKLYHDKYKHDDRYEDRYEDRRDDRRRERIEKIDPRYERVEIKPKHETDDRRQKTQVVEIQPGGRGGAPPSPGLSGRTRGLSLSTGGLKPSGLTLAAPGAPSHNRRGSFGAPPGSPLLESYRGTYQTISPMPSPMALAHHPDDSDLSDLDLPGGFGGGKPARRKHADDASTDDSDVSRGGRKPKSILKRAAERDSESSYDPDEDSRLLATELKRSSPDSHVLVKILPTLRNDSIAALRSEYKKHAKINGKGINVAKHIKMKMGTTNVGKAAYATALGRWESEAHWANFWYQSGSSRRELLIEALFGRSNAEVKAIKESFSDKRYGDSLVKCMEAELKKDKFRLAVLKVLEAKRGNDGEEVDRKLVRKDAKDLKAAVTSKEGGETAMINIIVVRSDEHLRLVLKEYEAEYEENFARQMIKKSQNLVGETLAHILNGVLNRPVRDALLLHQAIAETSKDRAELIISRLVRFHWEPRHLERIKTEYRKRYNVQLEQDIADGTKGEFSNYCIGLCKGAVK